MKEIKIPVILTEDSLDDAGLVIHMFKEALAIAFEQLAEESHPEDRDVDITLQYRVVKEAC